jgi:hypothetical protein
MRSRFCHAGHDPVYHHNIVLPAFTGVTTDITREGKKFHANWSCTHLHMDETEAQALWESLGTALGHTAPRVVAVRTRPLHIPAADGHSQ